MPINYERHKLSRLLRSHSVVLAKSNSIGQCCHVNPKSDLNFQVSSSRVKRIEPWLSTRCEKETSLAKKIGHCYLRAGFMLRYSSQQSRPTSEWRKCDTLNEDTVDRHGVIHLVSRRKTLPRNVCSMKQSFAGWTLAKVDSAIEELGDL